MQKVEIPISKENKPVASDKGNIMLPSAVVFALQAGRKELMKLAIAQVERNEIEPSKELVVNLLKILADYVDDCFNQNHKVADLEDRLGSLRDDMEEIRGCANRAIEAVDHAIDVVDQ